MQRPRRRDARVLLPQRSGGRVARIGENLLARFRLPLVEREEVLLGHVDFAAQLADRRNFPALELVRDLLHRPDIGGDVLALEAVAAGGGFDQLPVLVAQRHREPVDLRLGGERDRLVLLEIEEAADARDEIGDLLGVERVLQRQHRHRVAHLGEAARRRGADLARQALQRAQVRERFLDRLVAAAQRVVFRVRHRRRVLLVVGCVVLRDFGLKARVLGLGLLLGQFVDGDLAEIAGRHGPYLGHDGPPPTREGRISTGRAAG